MSGDTKCLRRDPPRMHNLRATDLTLKLSLFRYERREAYIPLITSPHAQPRGARPPAWPSAEDDAPPSPL